MNNNISLTASMRSNLLSLQNIAGQVDLTQNRLSTGLKVNSAIDNPSSYYTAVSLNNRASDLSALLDSMAQGIQTIKAATEGLEAGAGLLEQAAATATQALETNYIPAKSWFEEQEGVAAVVSSREELLATIASGKSGDIVIYGQIDMGNTAITLKKGQNLTGIGAYGITDNERGKFSALNFDVTGAVVVSGSVAMIKSAGDFSDLSLSFTGDIAGKSDHLIYLTNKDHDVSFKNMDIYADLENSTHYSSLIYGSGKNGGRLVFAGTNNLYRVDPPGIYTRVFVSSNVMTQAGTVFNAISGDQVFSGSKCEFNDAIINTQGTWGFSASDVVCNGTTVLNGYKNEGSSLTLNDQSRVDNAAHIFHGNLTITSAQASIHITQPELVSTYGYMQSSCTVKAVAGSKISLAGQIYQTDEDIDFTIENPTPPGGGIKDTPAEYQKVEGENYIQPPLPNLTYLATSQVYEKKTDGKQYAEIIKQYDSLIKDSSYKGINLLREQDLTVTFNENRSSKLAVQGKDASAQALGLVTTDWQNQGDVVKSIQELTDALNQIRQMSSELGNYYSIVTTRENFTQNLINVLTEGADKLTLADMNEESANMLALQTRQQLAVNSLSLASQASQSILKLF